MDSHPQGPTIKYVTVGQESSTEAADLRTSLALKVANAKEAAHSASMKGEIIARDFADLQANVDNLQREEMKLKVWPPLRFGKLLVVL